MSGENRSRSPGEGQREVGDIRAAANDNALARIARDVRRTAFGWRHAQAVGSFVDGRRQVLAAYDALRERTRIEGDAVALGGAFQETLTRHAGLLKQAAAFRARAGRLRLPASRARRHWPARISTPSRNSMPVHGGTGARPTMRHVHRIKRETEQEGVEPEMRQGEAASIAPAERIQPVRPRHDSAQSRAHPETAEHPARCCGRQRHGTRKAVLVCALHGIAPGLERLHRRRPASRYPFILRQGVCGHDPAHPGRWRRTRMSRP